MVCAYWRPAPRRAWAAPETSWVPKLFVESGQPSVRGGWRAFIDEGWPCTISFEIRDAVGPPRASADAHRIGS